MRSWTNANVEANRKMTDRTDSGNEEDTVVVAGDKSLHQRVGRWLAASEWRYSESSDGNWYSMQVNLDCGSVRTIIDTETRDDEETVMIYCVFPVRVPEARRIQVADFFSRLNHRAVLKSLQIDMADGEARVLASMSQTASAINDATLDRLLSLALRFADLAFAPMLSVAYGEVSASLANERILAEAERAASGVQLQ